MYKILFLIMLLVLSPWFILGTFSSVMCRTSSSIVTSTSSLTISTTNSYSIVTSTSSSTGSQPLKHNVNNYINQPKVRSVIAVHQDLYQDFHQDPSWTVSGSFNVRINLHDAVKIYAWQAVVTFDPYLSVVTNISAGDFLGSNVLVVNSTSGYFPKNPEVSVGDAILCYATDLAPGVLLIGGSRIGNVTGKNGGGTLATITFGVWSYVTHPNQNIDLKETMLIDDKITETNQGSLTIENDWQSSNAHARYGTR